MSEKVTTQIEAKAEEQTSSYDNMVYESYPYMNTSPERLATLGTLFGMTPPKIESAKVLELGCAGGGNIIPQAARNPKGKYLGIDLSRKQIEEGEQHIKELGLKNIELKHMSIADIDDSYGKFDYIICHGVFSWVSEEVQKKILEISKKNLTKNGIAYISYNTLPGWNMVRTVRDMMMYHSKSFSSITDKVSQARALLAFIQESLKGQDSAYSKMLSQEAELLSKQADCYIAHEHLEGDNKQFYFSDFMISAMQQGMQYLSDVAINTMYLGNMKPEVVEKLKKLNNIIQTEQYMDFINNRRFRSTLLCHNDIKLNRALDNKMIRKFAVYANLTAKEEITKDNIEQVKEASFYINNNKENMITSRSPHLTAALQTLVNNKGFPLSFDNLVKHANRFFKQDHKKDIEREFENIAMNMLIKGVLDITLDEKPKDKLNLLKPKVTPIVKYQVEHTQKNWVTSTHHTPVAINIFDKVALQYMNGSNDLDKITDLLIKDIQNGKLKMNRGDQAIEDPQEMKKELKNILSQSINKYAANGIFS